MRPDQELPEKQDNASGPVRATESVETDDFENLDFDDDDLDGCEVDLANLPESEVTTDDLLDLVVLSPEGDPIKLEEYRALFEAQ